MNKFIFKFAIIFLLVSCSNTPELETGEIKTLQMLKSAINQSVKPKTFIDARKLLSREQIDAANIPVLFVELESGQNGTLTPYPGQGVGQTWIGADGATVTLEQGILNATRGMGDDLMGSRSLMPPWSKIGIAVTQYHRRASFITGGNKIFERTFKCNIKKYDQKETIKIWGLNYQATKFEENCNHKDFKISNTYYLDNKEIVRKSLQFHGDTIGYIFTERLDR